MKSDFESGGKRNASETEHGSADPIARNLRRAFDEIASEPLPDDLTRLLERLKQQGGS